MKHTKLKSLLCLVLVVLLAAAALCLTGCQKPAETPATTEASPVITTEAKAEATTAAPVTTEAPVSTETPVTTEAPSEAPTELGEQGTLIYFDVTFADGGTASYAIHTEAENVGDALTALGLIAGEDSEYGLYVKTVCGETLDWDSQNMYWAFYENGEYAMTGVDTTAITEGATYGFVATKG